MYHTLSNSFYTYCTYCRQVLLHFLVQLKLTSKLTLKPITANRLISSTADFAGNGSQVSVKAYFHYSCAALRCAALRFVAIVRDSAR